MPRKILVATDGSRGAQAAARWAAVLAAACGARMSLAHVLPALPLALPDGMIFDRGAMEAMAAPALAAALASLPPGAQADTRVLLGAAGERLAALAEEEAYDLIAVGRRGLNPLAQLIVGSVSGRVLQLARCPVVVVQGLKTDGDFKEGSPMLRKVLLAVDGSPSSLAAARWVAALAQHLPDLHVTAVTVVRDPRLAASTLAGAYIPTELMDPESLQAMGQGVLDTARACLADAVHDYDGRVLVGSAAEGIVQLAEEGGFDLIAMGRRGLNPIAQLVLGSVSERVVHLAPCPVVIVRD